MPDPPFLDRVRQLFGADLQELAGAAISAEIPLSDTVLNRLIGERLDRSAGPISAAHVEALDDDTFSAELTLRGPRMLPTVRIVARIEQQPMGGPEGPPLHKREPVLVLRWSIPGMGPLGLLAAPALTFLKALPRGIRAEDDRIVVDVAEVLRSHGLGEWGRYLSTLRVHTRRGAVLVQFELRSSSGPVRPA